MYYLCIVNKNIYFFLRISVYTTRTYSISIQGSVQRNNNASAFVYSALQ